MGGKVSYVSYRMEIIGNVRRQALRLQYFLDLGVKIFSLRRSLLAEKRLNDPAAESGACLGTDGKGLYCLGEILAIRLRDVRIHFPAQPRRLERVNRGSGGQNVVR